MEKINSSYSIREKTISVSELCCRRFFIIIRTDQYADDYKTNDGCWHRSDMITTNTPISVIENDRFVAEEMVKELESIEKEIIPKQIE